MNRITLLYDRLLPEILDWVNSYNFWRQDKKPAPFRPIKQYAVYPQNDKGGGHVIYLERLQFIHRPDSTECELVGAHKRAVATIIFDSFNKQVPLLFVCVDHLEGMAIRNLTHRLHVFQCMREATEGLHKLQFLHIADYDFVGQGDINSYRIVRRDEFISPFLKDLMKIVAYTPSFAAINWVVEIEISRRMAMRNRYTDRSQAEARIRYASRIDLIMRDFETGALKIAAPVTGTIQQLYFARRARNVSEQETRQRISWEYKLGLWIGISLILAAILVAVAGVWLGFHTKLFVLPNLSNN